MTGRHGHPEGAGPHPSEPASCWRTDAQFVFLGSGEQKYETGAGGAGLRRRPTAIGVQLDFTDRLEHRLMAGADIFLMPSLYEPCGLTQMRAQRYGSPPIVRRVGGLADTVEDGVTGFAFDAVHAGGLPGGGFPRAGLLHASRALADNDASGHGARLQLGALRGHLSRRLPARRRPTAAARVSATLDGLRLHAAQPPALRAEPRAVAPRQRLALRGGGRHLSPAARDPPAPRAAEAVPAPVTIGFTPVLANQLASPVFVAEMEAFFEQRLAACDEAPAFTGRRPATPHLLPLVEYWRERLHPAPRSCSATSDGDLIGALPRPRGRGPPRDHRARPPLTASCRCSPATKASGSSSPSAWPSIAGCSAAPPNGCWLPECAYRPRGPWEPWPTAPRSGVRRGIEEHLADAGFRFFFVDAHLAAAGRPLGLSGDPPVDPTVQAPASPAASATRAAALAVSGLPGGRTRRRSCRLRPRPAGLDAGVEPASRAIRATSGTSSSTRCAGPAASSSGG